tara:strand:+ start:926 stop:1354 length:429 start_codon:yes stop_codon:yes gene_type:complete
MKLSEVKTDTPINLMFHDGIDEIKNDRDDAVTIDPTQTLAMADAVSEDHWRELKGSMAFMHKFRMVFGDLGLPDHPLQLHGSGVRHVVGLILLTDTAIGVGLNPFWKFPESYLHPSHQAGLGDLLINYAAHIDGKNNVAQPA